MPELHAELSPSSAHRWMACPGSIPMAAGMPDPSSEAADEGTRAHKMAEAMLKGRPDLYVEEYGEWDTGMETHVKVYVDHVQDLYTQSSSASKWIEREIRVSEKIWGTADSLIWHEDTATLHVVDLKYGSGKVVEVKNNPQLDIYALAALLTTKLKARKIVTTIVQPRAFHVDGSVRSVEFDAVYLMEFHADLMQAGANVQNAIQAHEKGEPLDDFLKPSSDACRWCRGAVKCPKARGVVQISAKQAFAPDTAYDPAELASVLSKLDMIEAYCKNIREFAYREAEAGRPAPGYKLVEKRATRKWKDDPALVFDLAEALDVPVADLRESKLKTLGDIEAMAPGKNKKERAAFLEPFTVKESSGYALVPESDDRPAIRMDAKSVFA